jgi:hypothetical protein
MKNEESKNEFGVDGGKPIVSPEDKKNLDEEDLPTAPAKKIEVFM